MNERSVVLMGGAPGSGTTRLGKSLENRLQSSHVSAEHVSIGDRIRRIGAGLIHSARTAEVISHLTNLPANHPVDDGVMYDLIAEVFDDFQGSQLVLLDGYPRYPAQVRHIEELAAADERTVRGLLVTKTDPETSLARTIKRGQKKPDRTVSLPEAVDRLAAHNDAFPGVIEALTARCIAIAEIDTSGSKMDADKAGLEALLRLVSLPRLQGNG